jgi:hypothetical protein
VPGNGRLWDSAVPRQCPRPLDRINNTERSRLCLGAGISHQLRKLHCDEKTKMKNTLRLWRPVIRAQRRAFSSSSRRLDNYAFIGLGQMVCLSDSTDLSLALC